MKSFKSINNEMKLPIKVPSDTKPWIFYKP